MYSSVDLHTHTTASDGTLTPKALVEVALRRKLRVLAVTDHDSTEGVDEALSAAGSTLELWPGVEVSTDVPGSEVHILGYLVDHTDIPFQAMLRRLRDSRLGRARQMVSKLNDLGVAISWARVQEIAGAGAVGRPHVAQAMIEQGYVATLPEAFQRFIGRNGPAYVERYRLTPEDAVRLIVRAGGLPALAHPVIVENGKESWLDLEDLLPRLASAGLAGIECYYLNYTRAIKRRLLKIAATWNLVATGGSDFHGLGNLVVGPGEVAVPDEVADRVRERLIQRQSGQQRAQQTEV